MYSTLLKKRGFFMRKKYPFVKLCSSKTALTLFKNYIFKKSKDLFLFHLFISIKQCLFIKIFKLIKH